MNPPEDLNIIYKSEPTIKDKVIVGIDEAGRGPVLGYLVYGALIATSKTVNDQAFRDSKKMTPQARQKEYQNIKEQANSLNYVYKAIHPQYITEKMTAEKPKTLNEISFDAVIEILTHIFKNYEVDTVYIDTLGCPIKYKQMLDKIFKKKKFVIESKADIKYKVVGGASIVAKVTRDTLLETWDISDKNYGSGYPSDPLTLKWLKRNFNPIFGYPNIVRFSWSTVSKKLKSKDKDFYFESC